MCWILSYCYRLGIYSAFLKPSGQFLAGWKIKLTSAWPSGSERRFCDGHDRKVYGSTPTQALFLRPWIRCFTTIILDKTVQMVEWYRASASGSVDLGFDSESGQTNDFKIGIHSFPA